MLSIGIKLGEDETRVALLIVVPLSTPVIITTFCDKISPLCDELNKSDKIEIIGWKRIEHHDGDLGVRVKFRASSELAPSELVNIVTNALVDVYNCDLRIYNEQSKEPQETI